MVARSVAASGARLSQTTVMTLSASASDDRGIARVDFLDDERTVCSGHDGAVHLRLPAAGRRRRAQHARGDRSRHVRPDGQRRPAGRRPWFVGRLSAPTTPRRDTTAPYRFTTTGRRTLPAGVTPGQGCRGTVTVQIKAGRKTVLDAARAAALELHLPFARHVPDRAATAATHAAADRAVRRQCGDGRAERSAADAADPLGGGMGPPQRRETRAASSITSSRLPARPEQAADRLRVRRPHLRRARPIWATTPPPAGRRWRCPRSLRCAGTMCSLRDAPLARAGVCDSVDQRRGRAGVAAQGAGLIGNGN